MLGSWLKRLGLKLVTAEVEIELQARVSDQLLLECAVRIHLVASYVFTLWQLCLL